ncbi:hypothetical protein Tco_0987588 [Tanacetum coccineum]
MMVTSAVAGGGDSQSDEDDEVFKRGLKILLSGALMSMRRVFETRLRRRRVKQSGEINIEFKTVNEYTVKVNEWWGEGDDVGAAGGCSGGVRRWLRRWKMMLVVLMIYGSVWRWRSIVVCRLSWPDVGGGAGSLAEKRRGAENDI